MAAGRGGVRQADTEDERSTPGGENIENKSLNGVDLTFLLKTESFV